MKHSIPTEISLVQNTTLADECQSPMYLLPSNLNKQDYYRNANHHISPALVHRYRTPFQSEWDLNNKMMQCEYYLQLGQYENMNKDNFHQVSPYPVSLNPSFVSVESNLSTPTSDGYSITPKTAKRQLSESNPLMNKKPRLMYCTQQTKSDNLIQSCSTPNQQYTSSPSPSSLSSFPSITAPVVRSAKTKRNYAKRMRQSAIEQQLLQHPTNANNCWSSLPLPSMTNTLHRFDGYTYPTDSIQTSHYPNNSFEQYPTSRQYLSDQKCNFMPKMINNCITNNLAYNLPYFLTPSYYLFPPNPIPMKKSTETCSNLLSELNTTFSPVSFVHNMKKEQTDPEISKFTQNSSTKIQINEEDVVPSISKMPILRGRLQKKSKLGDHRIKTLIKRMTQKNKLAVLKFMIHKRKQQRILKKKLSEMKINKIIVPQINEDNISKITEMTSELPDILTSSLKITLNAANKIESISLCYHQRHKPEISTKYSSITSNNKLGLLIEAVNFIEMHHDSSKLVLESIK